MVLRDDDLCALILALRRRPDGGNHQRLFCFHDGLEWNPATAAQANQRFKRLAGADFTLKDLRTWQATVRAALFLSEEMSSREDPEQVTEAQRRRVLAAVMQRVAADLGNTPAVARSSYVDPRVVDADTDLSIVERVVAALPSTDLSRPRVRAQLERSVIELLTGMDEE